MNRYKLIIELEVAENISRKEVFQRSGEIFTITQLRFERPEFRFIDYDVKEGGKNE